MMLSSKGEGAWGMGRAKHPPHWGSPPRHGSFNIRQLGDVAQVLEVLHAGHTASSERFAITQELHA
ncbi:hypothetical protein LOD50_11455, partial [Xylella fastidiosa subsp. multiplex]|uniref:hypothetical protein n=1 Tax=Xylella fastidiosa TaxID=2371 RepID=UPI00235E174B